LRGESESDWKKSFNSKPSTVAAKPNKELLENDQKRPWKLK